MTRLSDLVLRRRRLVAGAWLLLAIAGVWASSGLSGALSQSFDAPGRPAFEANREIVERFGSGGVIAPIVAVVDGADARDPAVARVRCERLRPGDLHARVADAQVARRSARGGERLGVLVRRRPPRRRQDDRGGGAPVIGDELRSGGEP